MSDLQALKNELEIVLKESLPRFCNELPPQEATLLKRLALSHWQQLDEARLAEWAQKPRELVKALMIGHVFASLAHLIGEDLRRSPEKSVFDRVLRNISCGLDGRPLASFNFTTIADRRDRYLSIHQALHSLKQEEPQIHEAILLRHYDDMSRKLASKVLGISIGRLRQMEKVGTKFIKDRISSVS